MEKIIGFSIRTRYNFQREYVVSKDKELNLKNYLDECAKTFRISSEMNVEMYFDHTGIHEADFEFIAKKEGRCASFYIHLIATPKSSDKAVITMLDLETFLRSRNAGIIIEKGRAENSQLTEAERKFLIHHAHTYLTQKFQTVDRMQMIIVSKMMVFMVPSLKDFTEGEHAGYSVTLKFLSKKFTNAKHNARKRFSQPPEPFEVEKLDFFKNIVVSDENMALIIDQLKATVVQRCEIIKEVKLDFLEQFPIFFPHPQLILEDFAIRFSAQVNPNGFLENWRRYADNVEVVITKNYNVKNFHTMWTGDIEKVLMFMSVLSAKGGRNTPAGSVLPFKKAIDKLVVFSEKMPAQKDLDTNAFPYIVAFGKTPEDITHYYIAVENHLIDVPDEWEYHQVIDLYFKVHLNFELKFEVNIQPLMTYFACFLYAWKTPMFKPTLSMNSLETKMNSAISVSNANGA